MKSLLWTSLFILLVSFSCIDEEDARRQDLLVLDQLRSEIIALSESVSCTNADQWKFSPMGSKACGGPERYVAYHQSVETSILALIEQYTFQQAQYNQANNVVSDCLLILTPQGVKCENEKPVLF
ncbi:hypothetical protein [Algoriphagus confluentis]|uniref:Uncharacterized protein n=1 Tax=Algoriphagus confluentis TaxID=1697556 RepID=A0ABQ6PNH9_9BACT|nr:hypothetical protein Aconfl_18640 [Algoriphagus confluentis]